MPIRRYSFCRRKMGVTTQMSQRRMKPGAVCSTSLKRVTVATAIGFTTLYLFFPMSSPIHGVDWVHARTHWTWWRRLYHNYSDVYESVQCRPMLLYRLQGSWELNPSSCNMLGVPLLVLGHFASSVSRHSISPSCLPWLHLVASTFQVYPSLACPWLRWDEPRTDLASACGKSVRWVGQRCPERISLLSPGHASSRRRRHLTD